MHKSLASGGRGCALTRFRLATDTRLPDPHQRCGQHPGICRTSSAPSAPAGHPSKRQSNHPGELGPVATRAARFLRINLGASRGLQLGDLASQVLFPGAHTGVSEVHGVALFCSTIYATIIRRVFRIAAGSNSWTARCWPNRDEVAYPARDETRFPCHSQSDFPGRLTLKKRRAWWTGQSAGRSAELFPEAALNQTDDTRD
jgi:hypothetical protein